MGGTADFLGDLQHFHQGNRVSRRRLHAICVPRRGSVSRYLPGLHGRFQDFKRPFETAVEGLAGAMFELGLRVVNVVEIDGLETQVPSADLNLIRQVFGRHDMTSCGHIVRLHQPRIEVPFPKIGVRVRRLLTVKSQKAAFCGDEDLVAAKLSGQDSLREGIADGPFAALMAVVHRRVKYVHAQLERSMRRAPIECIRRRIRLSQVGSEANRGQPQVVRLAEMAGKLPAEVIAEPGGALKCRSAGYEFSPRSHDILYSLGQRLPGKRVPRSTRSSVC